MKCSIPEISWHNREPVLSVDIHPISKDFYRLASGGADCHVLIWQMIININGAIKQEVISDLKRHQKAVNAVRWSPNGLNLATADDDANIIIWHLKSDNIPLLEGEVEDREIWMVSKVLRGHKEDIYDICWSVDNSKLLSGSIDNTAILWDFNKGKSDLILTDHKGFVQGVAWDPKDQYIATISTDRVCRIFDKNGKHVKARICKGKLPVPEDHFMHDKEVKFFHDDTFKSFFRRLHFSPDGSILAVPSGSIETEDCKKTLNATFIFCVESWGIPAAVLPLPKECSTVVRFCPLLFELRESGPDPYINLPYRMIMAVGTEHDVILYDTQQLSPFARFHDIHYTRLTDLTWSQDALLLIASSTDGFCALITFDADELGAVYIKEESEVEDNVLNISGCEPLEDTKENDSGKQVAESSTKVKKSSFLEKWAKNTPNKEKNGIKLKQVDSTDKYLKADFKNNDIGKINTIVPRRITPTSVTRIAHEIKAVGDDGSKIKDDISGCEQFSNLKKNKDNENKSDHAVEQSSFLKKWVNKDKKDTKSQQINTDLKLSKTEPETKNSSANVSNSDNKSSKIDSDAKNNSTNISKRITPIPFVDVKQANNDNPANEVTLTSTNVNQNIEPPKTPKRIKPIPLNNKTPKRIKPTPVDEGATTPRRITPILISSKDSPKAGEKNTLQNSFQNDTKPPK